MKALMNWLDDRTGIKGLLHEALYERVPGGARWRYVWGSTLVFTFVLQVITGFMLWSAYSPSTRTAWESVYYIQNEMTLGFVIRGIHHFAAQAMVVLMAIHLVQVIIDGAYKAPREMNFWLGIVLMKIVLGLSLTGYLLPWDQKGYYATQVTTNIMSATPVAGEQVQVLAQGGTQYSVRHYGDVHSQIRARFANYKDVLSFGGFNSNWLHEESGPFFFFSVYEGFGLSAYEAAQAGKSVFVNSAFPSDLTSLLANINLIDTGSRGRPILKQLLNALSTYN